MPLAAPVQVAPISGSPLLGKATFQWLTVPGATKYRVWWSLDPFYGSFFSIETTGLSVETPYIFGMGTWYWRVAAYDGSAWGAWSTDWNFVVGDCVLTKTHPTDGLNFGAPNPPYMIWEPAYGLQYEIQVDTGITFPAPVSVVTTSPMGPLPTELAMGWYFWRVRQSSDGVTWSSWSDIWTFRITLVPPAGLKIVPGYNSFKATWDRVVNPALAGYKIAYTPSRNEAGVVLDVGNETFAEITDLIPGNTYMVSVAAYDTSAVLGQASDIRVAEINDLPQVKLFQPAGGPEIDFVWLLKPKATSYELEIDSSMVFGTINLRTYSIDPTGMEVTGFYHESMPSQRRAAQTWYYRLRPVEGVAGDYFWSNSDVAKVRLDGYRRSEISLKEDVYSPSIVVKSMDGATTYILNSDYLFEAPNKLYRKDGSTISDGDSVLVLFDHQLAFQIEADERRKRREMLNSTLDRNYHDVVSRTTDVYKLFDVYAKEHADVKTALLDYAALASLYTVNKEDLDIAFGYLVDTQSQITFPRVWPVTRSLIWAFANGGTKQAVSMGIKALTGEVPLISKVRPTYASYDVAPPAGDPDYYVGPADDPDETDEWRLIEGIGFAADAEDWEISIYNATTPTRRILHRGVMGTSGRLL